MSSFQKLGIEPGRAVCYSGYRDGQSPDIPAFPTREQIREDLQILQKRWQYLRLYDCSEHAVRTLEVIRENGMPFRVMLGAYIGAEVNNPQCPWGKAYKPEELEQNKARNIAGIKRLVELANAYPDIVFSLSAGNEATVDWTDHMVPVKQVIHYTRMIKKGARQPVTFCENYVPWRDKLAELADELDFISIHTYPVWEYQHIDNALDYTKANLYSVAERYPEKPVVITEAGWTTNANGNGINPENASEELQEIYTHALEDWCREEGILMFLFEAFDEAWKGSADDLEPEKHWGVFTADRKPKKVMQPFYRELAANR